MNLSLGEMLRRLRIKKELSQRQLGDLLHVDRSTVSKWESDTRQPDAAMISRLSDFLQTDVTQLMNSSRKDKDNTPLNVIVVDDEKIILNGEITALTEAMPGAEIFGFADPSGAKDFAKKNKVQLAFLDIELGRISGLDVCRELLEIEPHMNVVYLTGFQQYAFDAWKTGACGYLMKPLRPEELRDQFSRLRWPIVWGESL